MEAVCLMSLVQNLHHAVYQLRADDTREECQQLLFHHACLIKQLERVIIRKMACEGMDLIASSSNKENTLVLLTGLFETMQRVWLTRWSQLSLVSDEFDANACNFVLHYWFPRWRNPVTRLLAARDAEEDEKLCLTPLVTLPTPTPEEEEEEEEEEQHIDEETREEDIGSDSDDVTVVKPKTITSERVTTKPEPDIETTSEPDKDDDDNDGNVEHEVVGLQYETDRIYAWEERGAWNMVLNYTHEHWLNTRSFHRRREIIDDLYGVVSRNLTLVDELDVDKDEGNVSEAHEDWATLVCHTIFLASEYGTSEWSLVEALECQAQKEPPQTPPSPSLVEEKPTDDAKSEHVDYTMSHRDRVQLTRDMQTLLANWMAQLLQDEEEDTEYIGRMLCIQIATAYVLATHPRDTAPNSKNEHWEYVKHYRELLIEYILAHQGDVGCDMFEPHSNEAVQDMIVGRMHQAAALLFTTVMRREAEYLVHVMPTTCTSDEPSPAPSSLDTDGFVVVRRTSMSSSFPASAFPSTSNVTMIEPPLLSPTATPGCHYLTYKMHGGLWDKFGGCNDAGRARRAQLHRPIHSTMPLRISERLHACPVCEKPWEEEEEEQEEQEEEEEDSTPVSDSATLVCDQCERMFHNDCLVTPLLHVPEGEWHCHVGGTCAARACIECVASLLASWPISPFHPASCVIGCSSSPDI
jgi:hypothetical protein